MVHLNIRSITDHFIELISCIDSLDFVFKIIAISETWLKPYHMDYIIPNYSIVTPDISNFIRELCICRDSGELSVLSSTEMSQLFGYICTI